MQSDGADVMKVGNSGKRTRMENQAADDKKMLPILRQHWLLLLLATLIGSAAGGGLSVILPPTYTAKAVIFPPQQQGAAAMAALGSLGALAGLAGGSMKSSVDQYVALMKSTSVADRIIDKFGLAEVYDEEYRVEIRKKLEKYVSINAGKKDGLITIEVDDKNPKRAADMANAYVDGLRYMSNNLAIGEAQQRRVFFENKLKESRDALTKAQLALQSSGFNPGALKSEPKAAAERYAKLRAEIVNAEIRLQGLRNTLTDGSVEVKQQQTVLTALRGELGLLEKSSARSAENDESSADYVTRFREFKYQETLYELFARQYESARVDESREGALIQVVDVATVPEKKSKPKMAILIPVGAFVSLFCAMFYVMGLRYRKDGLI